MDDVKAQKDRNFQTGLERRPLQLIRHAGAADIERRAEQPFAGHFEMLGAVSAVAFAIELLHLTELLGQRHTGQQSIDLLLDYPVPGRRSRLLARNRRPACDDQQQETKKQNCCFFHIDLVVARPTTDLR